MVDNWEIEWNSSMMEHGRDLGTMEFIFAKGGTVADMNYVMFDIQDNSWEPLIKAVAERDNSHPDIIRKNVQQQQGALGVPQGFTPGVAVNPQMVVAANPRAVKQANRAMRSAQAGEAVRGGSTKVGDLANAGFYGQAAMQAGKNIMGATGRGLSAAKDMGGRAMAGAKDMGGRALQAVKESGIGQRMGNFMGKVGRGISDLRFLPQAAKQSYNQMRAAGEDEARRSALESGLGRGQKELDDAERRFVPGSQGFDTNMNQARASTSQGLARDFNVTPRVHTKGKNKGKPMESVEDAMRREIQEIGARRAEPKEGFFASMRRQGDERREAARAQREGDAFAPSNIVPEEPPKLPDAPSPEAARAANADAKVKDTNNDDMNIDFGPETGTPPDTGAGQPMKVEAEPQMETATATEPTRGQTAVTDAGMKIGATAGDRVAGGLDEFFAQHEKTPFADREAARQAMLQGNIGTSRMKEAGKFSGKTAKAVEQVLTEMYGPAKAKAIVQAAEQGNPEAKEIVEEVAEQTGNSDMNIDFGPDVMTLSGDEHEASWDSLLKQMNIR